VKIIILLLALISSQSFANPSLGVNYLMSAPITLWDWGRFKIDKELEPFEGDNTFTVCSTSYIWDDDSLVIKCLGGRKGPEYLSMKAGQELTNEIIRHIRLSLGYYTDSYNSYSDYRSTMKGEYKQYPIESYFHNSDFQSKNKPKNIGKILEKMIKISITIDDFEDGGVYICEATLQGDMPMCNYMTVGDIGKAAGNLLLRMTQP
jgi:hypothetical protein